MNRTKRLISFILSTVLLFSVIVTPASAQESRTYTSNITTYKQAGYTIDYKIKATWDNSQSIDVKITNTGTDSILNWAVQYNASGTITELSNAVIYKQTDNTYLLKNSGENYEIEPGKSQSFNYTLTGENLSIPSDISLASNEVIKQDGVDIQYKINDDWGNGFQAKITISNNTDAPLEAWKLSFDSNFSILNIWDSKIVSQSDNSYTLGSKSWTNPIPANSVHTISFTGKKEPSVRAEMSDFVLSEVVIAEEIDWEDPTDSDNDGLPDVYESNAFQTNPNKTDTDGDGLSDNVEIFEITTDPLKIDSDEDQITDDLEDYDEDGLNNITEVKLGTALNDADTDGDKLSDGEEINVCGTNPTKYDTDNDSISDGDEIKIGLDPNNSNTFGCPDAEYTFDQKITAEQLAEINNDNSYYVEVDITAGGIAEKAFSVSESPYASSMQNNDAVLGKIIELGYATELKVDSATITFTIPESNMGTPTGRYNDPGLTDVQRFQIFKYDTDYNIMYPIETTFDTENNSLSATVTELGNYLVLDLDKWMYNLGIAPINEVSQPIMLNDMLPSITTSPNTDMSVSGNNLQDTVSGGDLQHTVSDNDLHYTEDIPKEPEPLPEDYDDIMQEQIENVLDINTSPFSAMSRTMMSLPKYNQQIDLVFVIDTSGSMTDAINTCKRKMATLVSDLYNDGITCNVSVISFRDKEYEIKKHLTNDNQLWAKTPSQAQEMINQLTAKRCILENHIDALDVAKNLPYGPNNPKFMVIVSDTTIFEDATNCGKSTDTIATELKERGIVTSVVSRTSKTYQPLYEETKGIQTSIDGDFHRYLYAFISGHLQNNKVYTYISANDLCIRTLKAPLVRNGSTDSDTDGLTDWEETDILTIENFQNGPFEDGVDINIPTFEQYISYLSFGDAASFNRINKYYSDEIAMLRILPIVSDPMSKDGDRDGILDVEDPSPLNCTTSDKMLTPHATSNILYRFDDSFFFKDNTIYNKELCIASSIFASAVYENISLESHPDTTPNNAFIDELMTYHGFEKVHIEKLEDNPQYKDQHITDVAIGQKKVLYNGQKADIIAISIRGTDGTVEEWSSNFDIGTSNTITDNEDNVVQKNSDWIHPENHMGFDIAATRVTKFINEYISEKCDKTTPKILWITGHSRGAGIANIIGANFSDTYKCFVYTFACPNTTTAENAEQYNNIFNIVNSDDIITELPLNDWDFKKYGIVKSLSIGDNYKYLWNYSTGKLYLYNTNSKERLLDNFSTLVDLRNDCYSYTCSCHGNGSDNSITQILDFYPDMLKYGENYCKINPYIYGETKKIKTCQTTAYFMQYLAALAATASSDKFLAVNMALEDLSPKYSTVKREFLLYCPYIFTPHYQESYYLLARCLR